MIGYYPNFDQDIKESFNSLIAEFDLKLEHPNEGTFLLKGKNCVLQFIYDRGETGCAFNSINDIGVNPGYQVDYVYKFLYPEEKLPEATIDDYYNPKFQLNKFAYLIENKLKNILRGDFSWLADYRKSKQINW